MTKVSTILVLLLFFGVLPSGFAEEPLNLRGTWTGYFTYDGQAFEQGMPFSLVLSQDGEKLRGNIIEPTFHEGKVVVAKANVEGVIQGKFLTFAKEYDGTLDMNHTVNYRLEFKDGYFIGEWVYQDFSGKAIMSGPPVPGWVEILKRTYN